MASTSIIRARAQRICGHKIRYSLNTRAKLASETLQLHLQDTWKVSDRLTVEAGFKTSGQWADA
jgi:hypothetical protein